MKIWHEIKSLLEQGRSLYLLTVVQSVGSAPGRRGFKMLVASNDYLFGSIGGGIMEFNMVEKAKKLLLDGVNQQQVIIQDHRGSSNSSSGMICSGSQTIAFNLLTTEDLMLVSACTQTTIMLELSPKGIQSVSKNNPECFSIKFADVWTYTESINPINLPKAHIFGAGHVSLPTSELLTEIGFEVCLYDNRENINTFDNNQFVNLKDHIDYNNIMANVSIGQNDYVLIMTHKFTEDKLILSQLIRLDCKYIGVLGSDNKITVMFDALLKAGFKQNQLDKIDAPIGLDIASQTTQEIAISIVAQIIKIKNSRLD